MLCFQRRVGVGLKWYWLCVWVLVRIWKWWVVVLAGCLGISKGLGQCVVVLAGCLGFSEDLQAVGSSTYWVFGFQ